MKTGKLLAAGALAFALSAGLAHAKIPVQPMDDAAKAKAEEAKTKAADAAKTEAEQLSKAQDRVAERYKKGQGKGAEPVTVATKGATSVAVAKSAMPAAVAKGATPAASSTKK
jgi:hypothetical protein